MAQMGMQMQGGMLRKRGATPDVYTGLAFVAFACLLAACIIVWMSASKVGKDGSAFGMQEKGKVTLVRPAAR